MDYNELGENLSEMLKLENEPVAIGWSVKEPRNVEKEADQSRFCAKLKKAMQGEIFYSTLEEEECMGGARYSGLKDMAEYPANVQSGAFMVPPMPNRAWKYFMPMPMILENTDWALMQLPYAVPWRPPHIWLEKSLMGSVMWPPGRAWASLQKKSWLVFLPAIYPV